MVDQQLGLPSHRTAQVHSLLGPHTFAFRKVPPLSFQRQSLQPLISHSPGACLSPDRSLTGRDWGGEAREGLKGSRGGGDWWKRDWGWGQGKRMQPWGQELLGTTEDSPPLLLTKLEERHSPPSAQAQKHPALQSRAAAPGQSRKFTPVPPVPARAEKQRADTKTC